MINDLAQRITNAIFRQEGMPADYNNPGNLRGAPWLKDPLIYNSFWEPSTRAEGEAGALHVVALHIAEGNTLRQLIEIWAPPSDNNNTEQYIQNVKKWASIPDENVVLWTYIEEVGTFSKPRET
jgi:hypothetical protein